MSRNLTAGQILDAECSLFADYLIRKSPNAYVLEKYREAHKTSEAFRELVLDPFDAFLLSISRWHPLGLRIVDSYASWFFRRSVVRKKMVLLLAILECCPPTYSFFDSPDSPSPSAFCAQMLKQGIIFALSIVLGLALLAPVQVVWIARAGLASWREPWRIR